ncbi:MAG: hypothetical protein HC788_05580 [Sphingopyxis sp.]|nr:hypothetical protein [Sphingopyxis sp.]
MKSVITRGGVVTFVSKEEHEFIESIESVAYKDDLTERQTEIARMLTSRGVLQRFNDNDRGIYYKRNTNKGVE